MKLSPLNSGSFWSFLPTQPLFQFKFDSFALKVDITEFANLPKEKNL